MNQHPVIGVFGVSGSGKSSLIKLMSGDSSVLIGDGFESQTRDVQLYSSRVGLLKRHIDFIDKPGFDHSHGDVSDTEILHKIGAFLRKRSPKGVRVTGIIYTHRIDNTIHAMGSTKKYLETLHDFCGTQALQNVLIVTIGWDTCDVVTGALREEKLRSLDIVHKLERGGGICIRHDDGARSAHKILCYLLEKDAVDLTLSMNPAITLDKVSHKTPVVTHQHEERFPNDLEKVKDTFNQPETRTCFIDEKDLELPDLPLKISLDNLRVVKYSESDRSILVSVSAQIDGPVPMIFSGNLTVYYNRIQVGHMELKELHLKDGGSKFIDLPFHFKPPPEASEDLGRLFQGLFLSDGDVDLLLVVESESFKNQYNTTRFKTKSSIKGTKLVLVKKVHVYIGIKVLTSKTISFQFHFNNPFPVDLALLNFNIYAGTMGKIIAVANSRKALRVPSESNKISERANDAQVTAGYITAGRFILGGPTKELSIDLKIDSATIMMGNLTMTKLKLDIIDVPLSYGQPGKHAEFAKAEK